MANEVWYGGIVTKDKAVINTVWNDIETDSDNLKTTMIIGLLAM